MSKHFVTWFDISIPDLSKVHKLMVSFSCNLCNLVHAHFTKLSSCMHSLCSLFVSNQVLNITSSKSRLQWVSVSSLILCSQRNSCHNCIYYDKISPVTETKTLDWSAKTLKPVTSFSVVADQCIYCFKIVFYPHVLDQSAFPQLMTLHPPLQPRLWLLGPIHRATQPQFPLCKGSVGGWILWTEERVASGTFFKTFN